MAKDPDFQLGAEIIENISKEHEMLGTVLQDWLDFEAETFARLDKPENFKTLGLTLVKVQK